MSSKLRIRIGEVEIDYEGTEEFLKQELPQLLKTAMELHKASGISASGMGAVQNKTINAGSSGAVPSLTTGSIAAKLGAKTGSDLLVAATAHLALVKKAEPFSRQALLTEMKSATSYYKANYSSNLTKLLKTALQKGGVLSETAKNAYAMTASSRADLEAKLAHG